MMKPSKSSFDSDDLDSEKTQVQAVIALFILFVVIGMPIWWKTTEVYRADLPYSEISSLQSDFTFSVRVEIEIANFDAKLNMAHFSSMLKMELDEIVLDGSVKVSYMIRIADNNAFFIDKTESVGENCVKIVFLHSDKEGFEVTVTRLRTVYVSVAKEVISDDSKLRKLCLSIVNVLRKKIVNEGILNEIMSDIYRTRTVHTHDMSIRKMVQSNPKFELLFSLLNPDPETVLAEWSIKQAVDMYVEPIIAKLRSIFSFHVGSQVLYNTRVSFAPKSRKNPETDVTFYYLTKKQLSNVINSIESKLGSQLSSDPTLNFAVYVTEKKHTPLFLMKDDGNISKSNSFLVPRWGALAFYNVATKSKVARKHDINMKQVMEPFVAHLRTLLGIQELVNSTNIIYEHPFHIGVSDWEIDYLMRLRTIENLGNTIQTLVSLSKLLSQIHNIVIKDDIAQEVYEAVNAVSKAKINLKNGNLTEALKFSRIAFISSETAFFDPTLLELLYFPEDQKFAIYVPLFLPISLPLLISIVYAVKRFKKKQKLKSE